MNETEKAEQEAVMETRDIGISGMTCDKCVARVENALRGVNGVREVRVDRPAARATVTFDTVRTNIPALHDALLKSGYKPTALPA
ncbi:MAG TPA: heavy-metal-associated domain-containing protein [Verrucomicrobiae bacterium]|nr:heavy-metal-associated domain-containing protein [Verrucomicrobiae bacterium]